MSPRFTTSYSTLNGFLKPRSFGMRWWSGVWPPSNHAGILPPARAFWPFVPRPAVLPWPAAMPRPTRLAPCGTRARASDLELHASPCPRPMAASRPRTAAGPADLLDGHEEADLADHAARRVVGGHLDDEPMPCRPSALSVARLRAMWLIELLTWVTAGYRPSGIGGLGAAGRRCGERARRGGRRARRRSAGCAGPRASRG